MEYMYRVLKNPKDMEDTSCKNVDYMETIRGKVWELHDKGVTYKLMAERSGVCSATISNFSNCLTDGMNPKNWNKFRIFIEGMHKEIFGE